MANRLKLVLGGLINDDQNGFMKGRNIGCNIHTIIDLIEYSDYNNIPGSIVLLSKRLLIVLNMAFSLRFWLGLILVIILFNGLKPFTIRGKVMSSIMALLVALSICLVEFSRAALFHHSCFCLPLKSWLLQSAAMMISKGFKWETWKKDQFVGWWYHLFFAGRLEVFSDPF